MLLGAYSSIKSIKNMIFLKKWSKMSKRYTITISNDVAELLDKLAGMGDTNTEKIRNILIAWISDQKLVTKKLK
ncbi:Uncharacterised protein [uncultured archaeon]|nr:Uncharacterised protein [uncultured archaeon]